MTRFAVELLRCAQCPRRLTDPAGELDLMIARRTAAQHAVMIGIFGRAGDVRPKPRLGRAQRLVEFAVELPPSKTASALLPVRPAARRVRSTGAANAALRLVELDRPRRDWRRLPTYDRSAPGAHATAARRRASRTRRVRCQSSCEMYAGG
jgi:hypothetical protein